MIKMMKVFILKVKRNSDEVDPGAGTQNIIDGTGKKELFIGKKCTYAVKYKDDVVFASQKCKTCKISKELI